MPPRCSNIQLGASTFDEPSIRSAVVGAVRIAFKEVGGDFERPTPDALAKMVVVFARKAEAWGTPPDVIAHHQVQVGKLLVARGAAQS